MVVRKMVREVPRESMIPGMWVLGGAGGSTSRVVPRAIGGTPAHPAGKGPSEAGVTSRTPRTPVQLTRGRGWSGWSRAGSHSAGPSKSGWSTGGGRMPTPSGHGGWRAGAGAGRSATT